MTVHGGDRHRFSQALELDIIQEPGGRSFLEAIGYIFVNDQVYAPTPETFKLFCAQQGIQVEIHKDKSHLKADEYLKAYREGRYPVGALDYFYSHDIQDDHITALIVGGQELQQAIARSIETSLASGIMSAEDLTSLIDSFTASFRSVILPHGTLGEAYGKEQGRHTLQKYVDSIGISPETMDKLIATAQQRAQTFGLTPKELD